MKKHIMFCEDDPEISWLNENNLLAVGYEPICDIDDKQALDAISAYHFGFALCSISLLKLCTLELLSARRNGVNNAVDTTLLSLNTGSRGAFARTEL